MEGNMSIMEKLRRRYWRKQNYQFGSPIVALYTYDRFLVVATKLDLFISEDGINFRKVELPPAEQ